MELWHYTSIDVFTKIIENKTIRAGHIADMNDQSELNHGLSCIKKSLKSLLGDEQKKELGMLIDRAQKGDEEVYTTSFSQADDSLYQWNSYASRDKGIAIRFNIVSTKKQNLVGFYYNHVNNFRYCDRHESEDITCFPQLWTCEYIEKDKQTFCASPRKLDNLNRCKRLLN